MSTINVTNLKHASSGSNNIVLDSSGNATVAGTLANTGNLTITSGNLVLSNGNGIDFSATTNSSGTMTSELLADYEEGTFTPDYQGTTTGGTTTYYGSGYQVGKYTRIGRTVFIEIFLDWSAGTGSGNIVINGLPFTVGTNGNSGGSGLSIGSFEYIPLSANHVLIAVAVKNTTTISLRQYPIAGGSAPLVPYDTGGTIQISGCYHI